jgi:CPA2 family monovalent cation:H+ antiporter-2/glutathione-regulated potassium-efflux system ancillary protein KefC
LYCFCSASWRHEGEGQHFGDHYRDLFMALEEKIISAMQTDHIDRHSTSERGWTPPPKDYLNDFKDTE